MRPVRKGKYRQLVVCRAGHLAVLDALNEDHFKTKIRRGEPCRECVTRRLLRPISDPIIDAVYRLGGLEAAIIESYTARFQAAYNVVGRRRARKEALKSALKRQRAEQRAQGKGVSKKRKKRRPWR